MEDELVESFVKECVYLTATFCHAVIAVAIGSAGGIGLILCLLAFLCIAVCVYMAVYQHRRKQQVKS